MNATISTVSLPAPDHVVTCWARILRQQYPGRDARILADQAQSAVHDLYRFLHGTGYGGMWDLQPLLDLGWPAAYTLSLLFSSLRAVIRKLMADTDVHTLLWLMEQLDIWETVVIARWEANLPQYTWEQTASVVKHMEQVTTINQFVATLNETLDIISTLKATTQLVLSFTNAHTCAVYLLETDKLKLNAWSGEASAPKSVINRYDPKILEPLVVDNIRKDIPLRKLAQYLKTPQLRAAINMPLKVKDRVIGVLINGFTGTRTFSRYDINFLEILANYAGQAIFNALRFEQLGQITATHEQQRLAREMHDTILQTLACLNINLHVMLGYAREKQWERVESLIVDAHELGKMATQEGRDTLKGLHTGGFKADEKKLVDIIEPELTVFGKQSGIKPHITVKGDPRVSTSTAHHLSRLVSESLTNIYRHARAETVNVTIECDDSALCIHIVDDGVGFHPEHIDQRCSFGISGMQERSQLINGQVKIESVPGKGTSVTISCPVVGTSTAAR